MADSCPAITTYRGQQKRRFTAPFYLNGLTPSANIQSVHQPDAISTSEPVRFLIFILRFEALFSLARILARFASLRGYWTCMTIQLDAVDRVPLSVREASFFAAQSQS